MLYIRTVFAQDCGYILPQSWEDGAISEGWGPDVINDFDVQSTYTRYYAQASLRCRALRGISEGWARRRRITR